MKIAILPLWLPKFMFLNRTYVIANYVNNYIEKEDFTDLCEIVSITGKAVACNAQESTGNEMR